MTLSGVDKRRPHGRHAAHRVTVEADGPLTPTAGRTTSHYQLKQGVSAMVDGDGGAAPSEGLAGKHRNPFLVWLVWPLITLGIYHLVWWYKINNEARRLDPRIKVSPAVAVLALFPGGIVIVPALVSIWRTGGRIRSMQEAAGVMPSCAPLIGFILAFIFSLQSLYYQVQLNELWTGLADPAPDSPVPLQG
jgi:hypothetical protein